jgi:hypothetical protein
VLVDLIVALLHNAQPEIRSLLRRKLCEAVPKIAHRCLPSTDRSSSASRRSISWGSTCSAWHWVIASASPATVGSSLAPLASVDEG